MLALTVALHAATAAPTLGISGSCPGAATVSITGATPGAEVAIVSGEGLDGVIVPTGACAGTPLALSAPSVRAVRSTDNRGELLLTPNLPAGVCGDFVQVLDLATCETSGVNQIGSPGAGLLYWLPLNGNADNIAGSPDGAVVSNPTAAPDALGRQGRAVSFDGVDDVIIVPGTVLPTGSAPRTLTAWVRPTAPNGNPSIAGAVVHWGDLDCTGRMFGFGNRVDTTFFWGGCADLQSNHPLTHNVWHFVAVAWSPGTQGFVYTDGALQTTTQNLSTLPSSLYIGAETINDGDSYRDFFTGQLDDVRVYGRVLTQAELDAMYLAGPT